MNGVPQPPAVNPVKISPLALPVKRVMPNGVSLYLIEGGEESVVRLDILFKGGYAVQDKPLQALFAGRMLREGGGGLTGLEISQKLDFCGAWIDTYSSQECNHLTLYALPKYIPALLPLVEGFVKNPAFPEASLDTVRRSNKAHYVINSRKVGVVAQRHFELALWGENHPLGQIVVPEDYDNITCDDLWRYYGRVYSSCNCTLFLSGCASEAVVNAVAQSFGSEAWGSGEAVKVDVAAPTMFTGKKKVAVEGVVQSAIKVGGWSLPAAAADIYDFRFMNVLLGGYFGGRLMSNIREKNGFTYDIVSEMDAYGRENAFMVSSQADACYVEPLLRELYGEFERLRNEEPSAAEVELVRNYIMGELCREYEGVAAKAEVFINAWLAGEEFESVNRYIAAVKKITPARVRRVAEKYLKRENMFEIVVGE